MLSQAQDSACRGLNHQTIEANRLPINGPTGKFGVEDAVPYNPKPLLSRKEAASYLGIQPQTLAAWASNKRVPIPFVKLGRRVSYRLVDLEAFCARNRHGLNTSGKGD